VKRGLATRRALMGENPEAGCGAEGAKEEDEESVYWAVEGKVVDGGDVLSEREDEVVVEVVWTEEEGV
jgi:hypothetical protein